MKKAVETMKNGGHAPLFIVNANEKGGQGKSFCSLAIKDYATLCGVPLGVAQIDSQDRLAKALAHKVLTIEAVTGSARRDPAAETRSFTPLYDFLQRAARTGAGVLLDTGANQAHRFANWAGLVELQDDLDAWGVETIVIIPFVAEAEGIRQAAHTASLLLEVLPRAQLVLVENARDGGFSGLHPASDTAIAYHECIEPLTSQAKVLAMPAVEAGSWRLFEAANARLIHVAGMPVEKVMTLTGLPRPEAKIARGDVAGWAGAFFLELDRVLPWARQGGGND